MTEWERVVREHRAVCICQTPWRTSETLCQRCGLLLPVKDKPTETGNK